MSPCGKSSQDKCLALGSNVIVIHREGEIERDGWMELARGGSHDFHEKIHPLA